jgi:hypothetical protein
MHAPEKGRRIYLHPPPPPPQVGEAREALFAATIPEAPGAFRAFIAALGPGRSITEFNYRFASAGAPARVFVGVAVADRAEGRALIAGLGVPALDLTDDELAKTHVRYMVGGRAPACVAGERLFRFVFPERPGALALFLARLKTHWNISLFHYRNHGADFGRVLVGLQVRAQGGAWRGAADGGAWSAGKRRQGKRRHRETKAKRKAPRANASGEEITSSLLTALTAQPRILSAPNSLSLRWSRLLRTPCSKRTAARRRRPRRPRARSQPS